MKHTTISRHMNPDVNRDFSWEDIQLIGLETAGFQASRKQLLFGGYASTQVSGKPFTGRKHLIINNGGLRNKEASKGSKRLFKKWIKPALMASLPWLDEEFNGKLELHYGEGVLQQLDIRTY